MGSADPSSAVGSRPVGYPAELECDEQILGGATVHLRPIRPDDAGRLTAFHRRLSPQSVYHRFFFVHPKLSDEETERFTHLDYRDRLALVALDGDLLVAVGRYERISETAEAEVAFVVADEFQHHGIATLLLEHLADAALHRGITTFVAETLLENHDMLDVFRRSGFHVTTSSEFGTVSVRFAIDPDDEYWAARASRHRRPEDRGHRGADAP